MPWVQSQDANRDSSRQSSMHPWRTQAHEKDPPRMFVFLMVGIGVGIAFGFGIALGRHVDINADGDPDTDSDPGISRYHLYFRNSPPRSVTVPVFVSREIIRDFLS